MHAADLVGVQRLREEVDGRHLTAEDTLLVRLVRGADVAFVERLRRNNSFIMHEGTSVLSGRRSGRLLIVLTRFRPSLNPAYLPKIG